MAARRLLILMLILLGISSVVAVIIPNPRRDARERAAREQAADEDSKAKSNGAAGTGTEAADGSAKAGGPSAGSDLPASAAAPVRVTLGAGDPPRTIDAPVDAHLILTVESNLPAQVMIPALGLTGFADRWAPAVFDAILPAAVERIKVLTAPPIGQPETRRATVKVGS